MTFMCVRLYVFSKGSFILKMLWKIPVGRGIDKVFDLSPLSRIYLQYIYMSMTTKLFLVNNTSQQSHTYVLLYIYYYREFNFICVAVNVLRRQRTSFKIYKVNCAVDLARTLSICFSIAINEWDGTCCCCLISNFCNHTERSIDA